MEKIKKTYNLSEIVVDGIENRAHECGFPSGAKYLEYGFAALLLLDKSDIDAMAQHLDFMATSTQVEQEHGFARQKDMIKLKALASLIKCLTGAEKDYTSNMDNDGMRKIALKKGTALFPEYWIMLNPDQAAESMYAYIFEGRNSEAYHVPHFVYFTNTNYMDAPARDEVISSIMSMVRNYSDDTKKAFEAHDALEKKYPTVKDKIGHGDECKTVFEPGVFEMPVMGCNLYNFQYKDSEPPYGAKIVRPRGYDFSDENGYFPLYKL